MASWAYACQSPSAHGREPWYAACVAVDTLPAGTEIVRVRVGAQWHCARVDRSRRVAVDGALLRDVVASDAVDCPDCAVAVAPEPQAPESPVLPAASVAEPPAQPPSPPPTGAGREVHAAAISLQGRQFLVVLVGLDLVRSPGEADMAIAELQRRFGGTEVVLMGQLDDGTPEYHGQPETVGLLATVPVDRMPWKLYPLR